jgi:hypothetical protein
MRPTATADRERSRNLLYLAHPELWPGWPFLPLVRRLAGKEQECGPLCDLEGMAGVQGHPFTVFMSNLFVLPASLDAFLALPQEASATAEAVYAAGWRVD